MKQFDPLYEYRINSAEKFIYLIQKYAPDRLDLILKLQNDTEAFQRVKYYLAEIDRTNNWKVNYSSEDLKLVQDLFFYCGG
ncbi:MAG: hypothetical protein J6M05_04950 [Cardiobacteriaceae bacterium]|nr:hypothetical protein [Cardiobacteriaceae bacterium]